MNAIYEALNLLFTSLGPWVVVIPGLLIGLIFGATPGMQISMAMAIFLPMTLYMDFLQSMLFLTAIFTGGSFGGGVTAILMNIPGTSSAIATAFDGYPMALKGKHNEALGLALASSAIGVLFGYAILFVLINPISTIVLHIGPTEMFVIVLWGISLIATLGDTTLTKGLISGGLGLLIGTIGFSSLGVQRGTLGNEYLMDGIPVIPALMGMFAASELFRSSVKEFIVTNKEMRKVSFKGILNGCKETLKYPKIIFRGGLIGIIIGAIPGVGSSVSNIVSYSETKRTDKNPDSFGKGNPKGVVASESANSSSEAGSLATLLALGIPGGGATAVMLAAFAMHNITGGPQFIRDQTDIVYAIIIANFVCVLLLFFIGLAILPILANIIKIPMTFLVPIVLVLAILGSYSLAGNMMGPITVFVFAILGWIMKETGYSIPATIIGLMMGKLADTNLLYSYQISGGNIDYIFSRPITLVLIGLLLFSLFGKKCFYLLKGRRGKTYDDEKII